MLRCLLVAGYPGIILSDLQHWEIEHLQLADVAGSNANAVILTGNFTRVAIEYAVSADGECLERGYNPDRCDKYRALCMAPIVYTADFESSYQAYIAGTHRQLWPSPSRMRAGAAS
jgi:hypothetical protein